MLLEILLLCGLGCAAAGIFSMPTAIFFVVTYLLFGIVATIVTVDGYIIHHDAGVMARAEFGAFVGDLLLLVVIPLQEFDTSTLVADGVMIEWSFMWQMFLNYFVFRGLPLFLLGIYLYKRREIGLVIRK